MPFLKSLLNTIIGGSMFYCWRMGLDKILWPIVFVWLVMLAWDLAITISPYRKEW